MQRLRAGFLIRGVDGRLRHGKALFSGLAYSLRHDGTLEGLMAASEGVITGPSSDWLPLPDGGLRVNSALLEMPEDYGPRLFQGKPFTGIAYAFTRSGYCTSEIEYAGGFATEVSERRWYVSGQPKMRVDGGEYTSWFPDGRVQRRGSKGELVYGLNTRDDGHLRELVLRDARFLDMETLSALTPTEEFQMLGGAVDTAMLHTLREQTDIGAVPRLRLVQTRVGAEGVEILAAFKNLREVWFDGNPGLGLQEARKLERLRPSCVAHHVDLDASPPPRRPRALASAASGHGGRPLG